MNSCSGFGNTTTSSFGVPSPTPSDSSWVYTNYLSTNNINFQHSSNQNSPTSSIAHLSPSDESIYDIGTNYSPVSSALPSYLPSPSYGPNSSPTFLPPLGPNNPSEIHPPYAETFQPGLFPGISSSSGQLPPPSPLSLSAPSSEYLTGVSDLVIDNVLPPDWDLSSSPDPNPYFKLQVTSDAALAVSESKRKNPPICACHICGRDFTRKHSYTCKFNFLLSPFDASELFIQRICSLIMGSERSGAISVATFLQERSADIEKAARTTPTVNPPKRKKLLSSFRILRSSHQLPLVHFYLHISIASIFCWLPWTPIRLSFLHLTYTHHHSILFSSLSSPT